MGAGTSPAERELFLCGKPRDLSRNFAINVRFSPNLVAKRISVFRCGIRKDVFENFHVRGHLPPKSEIENRSKQELHSEQATGHGMQCR